MSLNNKKIINLPVFTQANIRLGYVSGFEIDELEQKIKHYHIKTHQGIAGLFEQELLISCKQVISLDKEKMIVEDAVIKESLKRGKEANKGAVPISS